MRQERRYQTIYVIMKLKINNSVLTCGNSPSPITHPGNNMHNEKGRYRKI
jgi:hypothetical protein